VIVGVLVAGQVIEVVVGGFVVDVAFDENLFVEIADTDYGQRDETLEFVHLVGDSFELNVGF